MKGIWKWIDVIFFSLISKLKLQIYFSDEMTNSNDDKNVGTTIGGRWRIVNIK